MSYQSQPRVPSNLRPRNPAAPVLPEPMTRKSLPDAPRLPEIRLELVEDLSPAGFGGFLRLIRRRYRAHYPDGSISEPFVYDQIDRRAIDAVVICAHYTGPQGRTVYLRSALRPPVFDRDPSRGPFRGHHPLGNLWELPAGLVEEGEQSESGTALTAQRELHEEVGFEVALGELEPLGPPVFPAPGFVAEQHFFFHVEVDPRRRGAPKLDGSPLEHMGVVIEVSLERALEMCRRGQIQDAKTELGLRRLAAELS